MGLTLILTYKKTRKNTRAEALVIFYSSLYRGITVRFRDLLIAHESVGVAEAHRGDLGLALEVDDEVARRLPRVVMRTIPRGHPVLVPRVGEGVRGGVVVVVPNTGPGIKVCRFC